MAGKKRGLTPGEKKLLQAVFGSAVDYDRIRLQDGAGLNPIAMIALRNPKNWAITYRNTIHYNKGHFRDDFTAGDDRVLEGLLVHEVSHVWQYTRLGVLAFGLRYGWNFVSCDFDQDTLYRYDDKTQFKSATLEAQADMIRHCWRAGVDGDAGKRKALETKLEGTGLFAA